MLENTTIDEINEMFEGRIERCETTLDILMVLVHYCQSDMEFSDWGNSEAPFDLYFTNFVSGRNFCVSNEGFSLMADGESDEQIDDDVEAMKAKIIAALKHEEEGEEELADG